jgi:hypothetical protein
MEQLNLHNFSTGEPANWPSDRNKLPDLLDFCVIKGIPHDFAFSKSCFELSSDHSPVLISLNLRALHQESQPTLCNRKTNWDYFRHLITMNLTLHVPLKTEAQIEDAVKHFTDLIQWAGWTATPETTCTTSSSDCPIFIKQKLAEKRRLRKEWHLHRTPPSKKLFNRATQELKQLLHYHRNYNIQTFLNGLTPTTSTDYSMWKTTKKLKNITQTSTPLRTPQGTWARTNADKAQAFASHLATVFQPHPPEPNSLPDDTLTSLLETPFQLEPPVHRLKRSEVQAITFLLRNRLVMT